MTTYLPYKVRIANPRAVFVVQQNLEYLRDVVDALEGKMLRGSATVLSGNTTVTVTHNYNTTAYTVGLAPTTDPGVGVRWWISSKTSTTFVITLSAAAPVGGISFDWILKGD